MTNLRSYFYAIILQCVFVSTFIVIDNYILPEHTFLHNKTMLCSAVLKGILLNISVPSKRLYSYVGIQGNCSGTC